MPLAGATTSPAAKLTSPGFVGAPQPRPVALARIHPVRRPSRPRRQRHQIRQQGRIRRACNRCTQRILPPTSAPPPAAAPRWRPDSASSAHRYSTIIRNSSSRAESGFRRWSVGTGPRDPFLPKYRRRQFRLRLPVVTFPFDGPGRCRPVRRAVSATTARPVQGATRRPCRDGGEVRGVERDASKQIT